MTVLWGNCPSRAFCVLNGICKGVVLSLFLFNVNGNILILHTHKLEIGYCVIKSTFVGCLLKDDDFILICPYVNI
jgi:hypothetical protein